ncbi:hypothetical protein J4G33_05310 [Actinotalea sp. BY-33]|uniref:Uncharacterized protein n=1 Tax=Actinotalea soli TaxID=2819234 RepID=A0A939LNP1_9CELL|nr:hypothetical protein [Actinotalea soli]MBO1751216.1 hypothetical protein [Actinotalea soli]
MGTVIFLVLLLGFLLALGRVRTPWVDRRPWREHTARDVGRTVLLGARSMVDLRQG